MCQLNVKAYACKPTADLPETALEHCFLMHLLLKTLIVFFWQKCRYVFFVNLRDINVGCTYPLGDIQDI